MSRDSAIDLGVLLAAVALVLALSSQGCTPATTRALCDTSGTVLAAATPETAPTKLGVQLATFLRRWLCPRQARPTLAPEGLPALMPDGPGLPAPLTAARELD